MLTCPVCGEHNPSRARFCLGCGHHLSPGDSAASEVRKTVTVLFCDLVGSTLLGARLDLERYKEVLTTYHALAKRQLEQHGGTVAKVMGDGVLAVFGIPSLHEDDALRAVTAATVLRSAIGSLNDELDEQLDVRLSVRIGVNTGEVLVREGTDELAQLVGDPVNIADRLQTAAEAREIL